MKLKTLLPLLFLLIIFSANLYSQESDTTKVKPDSTKWDNDWEWNDDWEWDDINFDVDFWDDWDDSYPSISLHYGLSKIDIDNFQPDFNNPNLLELKLGYSYSKPFMEQEDILKYKYKYLFLTNISTELSGDEDLSGINTKAWRFGYGENIAYANDIGDLEIIPYNGFSLSWTRLDSPFLTGESARNYLINEKLALWKGTFRFGTSAEGGIRLNFAEHFSVDAGYERAIVFPRHLFWKWAGSAIIEAAAFGLLDEFIEEIIERAPYAGPVVDFVLKNALYYGIYELRQEKMNWPFDSAAPLTYDQFKFGVTFSF